MRAYRIVHSDTYQEHCSWDGACNTYGLLENFMMTRLSRSQTAYCGLNCALGDEIHMLLECPAFGRSLVAILFAFLVLFRRHEAAALGQGPA